MCNYHLNTDYDTIVISGGSTSGICLLGQLFRLNLDYTKIRNFSGTSIGAVISFLLCIGYSPFEILTQIKNNLPVFRQVFGLKPTNIMLMVTHKSLYSIKLIKEMINQMIIAKLGFIPTFGQLNKNFLCCSFNYCKMRVEYFSTISTPDMDTSTALLLSCAIPFVFEPVLYNKDIYIDGGIIDNFPVKKTDDVFNCVSILGLVCTKVKQKKDKMVWNFDDILSILFCNSKYNSTLNLPLDKLKIKQVHSNVAFYDMTLTLDRMTNMFVHGLMSD
jgi:NTE family protein